ncbi:putative pentapeptide repeat protein [Magnetofaba australis IT-1]|uniref:Putative pentapeptide repeat protein n=2 Tax=Magnetofaba TaxID=1472292 RepID=A0A1Y2JZ41_9PROT|nr:putative pentapeptide repeat protein [Magnetofaba australis IT-1]
MMPVPVDVQNDPMDAANASGRLARGIHLGFLLVGVYFAILVGSTTHKQLLMESPITLPILDVPLPVVGFYAVVPWLFVLLHLNVLLQFHALAMRVIKVRENGLAGQEHRLYPLAFALWRARSSVKSSLVRAFLNLYVWLTTFILPPLIILWAQARFIPYHDHLITNVQRGALFVDLLLCWAFAIKILSPDGRFREFGIWMWSQKITLLITLTPFLLSIGGYLILSHGPQAYHADADAEAIKGFGFLAVPLMVAIFAGFFRESLVYRLALFAWMAPLSAACWLLSSQVFTIPHVCSNNPELYTDQERPFCNICTDGERSDNRDTVAYAKGYPAWMKWLVAEGRLPRYLIVRNETLVKQAPSEEQIAAYLAQGEQSEAGHKKAVQSAWVEQAKGLDLKGRDLTFADFTGSKLLKAQFNLPIERLKNNGNNSLQESIFNLKNSANLSFARLVDTDLTQANLSYVTLDHSKIMRSIMVKAYMSHSTVSAIINSDFTGADLSFTKLNRVNIYGSKFIGAKLSNIKWHSPRINSSNFSGSDFSRSEIFGGYISSSDFFGAYFQGAKILAAFFAESNFSGSNFGLKKNDEIFVRWRNQHFEEMENLNSDLEGSEFYNSDLSGVVANIAGIQMVDFRSSDISGSFFENSWLFESNFVDAKLNSSSFRYSYLKDKQVSFGELGSTHESIWEYINKLNNLKVTVGFSNWFTYFLHNIGRAGRLGKIRSKKYENMIENYINILDRMGIELVLSEGDFDGNLIKKHGRKHDWVFVSDKMLVEFKSQSRMGKNITSDESQYDKHIDNISQFWRVRFFCDKNPYIVFGISLNSSVNPRLARAFLERDCQNRPQATDFATPELWETFQERVKELEKIVKEDDAKKAKQKQAAEAKQ